MEEEPALLDGFGQRSVCFSNPRWRFTLCEIISDGSRVLVVRHRTLHSSFEAWRCVEESYLIARTLYLGWGRTTFIHYLLQVVEFKEGGGVGHVNLRRVLTGVYPSGKKNQ